MKVLLITNLYPNEAQPERGIFTAQKLTRLAARHEFKVVAPVAFFPLVQSPFAPPIDQVSAREQRDGVEVFHPRAWYLPRIGRRVNARLFAGSIRRLVTQLHKQFQFDLIWTTWGYPDVVAAVHLAQECGVPVLCELLGSDLNYGFQTEWCKREMLRALRRCEAIIVMSGAMRSSLLHEGLAPDRIFCVYNGVDHERFHRIDRTQACASTGLDPTRQRILFVGHLVPVKGLPSLLQAFRGLLTNSASNLELVLIGDGPQRQQLQNQASRLGIQSRVKFLGQQRHEDLCAFYNSSDLFCLPSLNEGLPNVILEAFACGLPVVASGVGGIPEIITDDGIGLMARPEDARSLEQALRSALSRPWDRDKIIAYSQQFDWQTTTRIMESLFQYTVGASPKVAPELLRQPLQVADDAFSRQARQLVDLALETLPRMYVPSHRLFCFKMIERDRQMVAVDVSVRYTAMTLIGLYEARVRGCNIPLSLPQLLDGLLAHDGQSLSIGDLGLVLWATAKVDPQRALSVFHSLQRRWKEESNDNRFICPSMYLQWMLCGLCEMLRQHPGHADAEKLLHAVYDALLQWHYHAAIGLFYYRPSQRRDLRRPFSQTTCYFAEQAYGIHALDSYARLTGNERAAGFALATARTVCREQSVNGGWAWLYNSLSGDQLDLYPVYSVHQLGMGPMAMLPLALDGNEEITAAIQRGVQWVFGANELPQPLVDRHHGIVWRSIKARYLPRQRHLLHKALSAGNLSALSHAKWLQPSSFQIDRECRPYELGWLLYALSSIKQPVSGETVT